MMKKFAIILILAIVSISLFSFTLTANAQTETDFEAYELYERFSKDYRQRSPGSTGENESALFIANKLTEFGYSAKDGQSEAINLLQTFSGEMLVEDISTLNVERIPFTSSNVVAFKRCGKENAKLLVLGCSYGNIYGFDESKSEGAYESSTAVATLLNIASKLSRTENLDFDLAFVFFGAEYINFAGSDNFLKENKQQILGYIDVDSIGGGEDLYVYYDDVKTAHGELIDSIISKFDFDVKGAPFNKGIYSLDAEIVSRPYLHEGLASSNVMFMEKGIPSVHLFGSNWAEFCGGESATKADIIGTDNDTFEYMDEHYGREFISGRLNLATEVVRTVVLKNTELAVAFEKYDNSYTNLYSTGVVWGVSLSLVALIVVLFVVGYVLASKKTKEAGASNFATNSSFLNGQNANVGVQKEDDVFDFGGEPIISDNKDIDTHENSSGDPDDDIFGEF